MASFDWTSFPAYASSEQIPFINPDFIVKMFGSEEKYAQFVADQVDYQRKLAHIKDLLIE